MAWFQSEKDRQRIAQLSALEDKRIAFARDIAAKGLHFERALLVQVGGGFEGIGLAAGNAYLLTGPAPVDEDGQFICEALPNVRASFEPFAIEGDGMNGMLGMGKKGGRGKKLVLHWDGGEREIEFVHALQMIYELKPGESFPLLNANKNPKDYNFVWDFASIQPHQLDFIAAHWAQLIATRSA